MSLAMLDVSQPKNSSSIGWAAFESNLRPSEPSGSVAGVIMLASMLEVRMLEAVIP